MLICTRNRPEHLEYCLAAVFCLAYPRFDVLVVDNAPSDERAREVTRRWGARYILEPLKGLSRARNRGARSCTTEIVAFIDDDAMPDPEWLTRLVTEFEDPRVMAVTGRILPLRIQTTTEYDCALIGGSSDQRRVIDRETPYWFELANFGGLGDGGNMAFRRRAFEIWPGFDERLGRGTTLDQCEEHHAFFSLLDRGYRVVYTPLGVVHHPYPRTAKEFRQRHFKLDVASAAYMTFLFIEEPFYRRKVARYAAEGLAGIHRPWREAVKQAHSPISHKLRSLVGRLYGPLLYLQSTFARRFFRASPASAHHDFAEFPTVCVEDSCPLAESFAIGGSPSQD